MSAAKPQQGIQVEFYNDAMEAPISQTYSNGTLFLYTYPSGWDKPMEDAVITVSNGENLIAAFVCDGMGGHAGADRAVLAAYESIKQVFTNAFSGKMPVPSTRECMLDAIELANINVKNLKVGAGSTIAAFEIGADYVRSYHAGDSICYFLGPRGKIKYLSLEHSLRGHALESGLVHEKNVDKHIEDNIVSNGLGFEPMTLEVTQPIELSNQDLLFLSSDNIAKLFSEDQIIEFVVNGEFEKRAENIHQELMKRIEETKKDDTSMALFKFAEKS